MDWDQRYRWEGSERLPPPAKTLLSMLPLLPPSGRVLDLACGTGRNAIFLAGRGYLAEGIDASSVAIQKGRRFAAEAGVEADFTAADLVDCTIAPGRYDLILDLYYLDRRLIPRIIAGLKCGGMVLFETYTTGQRAFGPPSNEAYLLEEGELPKLFSGLEIRWYREGITDDGDCKRCIATLVGVKG